MGEKSQNSKCTTRTTVVKKIIFPLQAQYKVEQTPNPTNFMFFYLRSSFETTLNFSSFVRKSPIFFFN